MNFNSKNRSSETWCVLPWIHAASLTDGSTQLCCVAEGVSGVNLNTQTLSDFWNSDYVKSARLKMLNGKKVKDCRRCYEEEGNGYRSHRIIENQNWVDKIGSEKIDRLIELTADDGALDSGIIAVDLRLGNKCNLQCVMCQPRESSRWNHGSKKLLEHLTSLKLVAEWNYKRNINYSLYEWYQNPKFWDDLHSLLPNIREIIIAGGEPMIIKEHLEFIKRCSETPYAKRIHIRYHTNLTEYPVEMAPYWEKFERIEIFASLDGMGDIANYIRYPSEWAKVEKHLAILDDTPNNTWLRILFSVQALNIGHLPEFVRWFKARNFKKQKDFKYMQGFIHPGIVHWPKYLNPKVLPKSLKEKISDDFAKLKLELNQPFDKFDGVINFMNSEDESFRLPALKEYLNALDLSRNTSAKDVFPELIAFIEPNESLAFEKSRRNESGSQYSGDPL